MALSWLLLFSLLASIASSQSGTISVTTLVTIIKSTSTVTASATETFEGLPPIESTTFSTVLVTSTTPSSNTFSTSKATSTTPEPTESTVWSLLNLLPTTDSLGHSTTISSWEVFTQGHSTATHAPTSGGQTSSQAPFATTSTTSSPTSTVTAAPGKKSIPYGAIIIPLILVFTAIVVWFIRRSIQRHNGSSSALRGEEDGQGGTPLNRLRRTSWDLSRLGRSSPGRAKERPIISPPMPLIPQPFSERSASPPTRPNRPASLSGSLMNDLQTFPTFLSTASDNAHRSLSPEPLQAAKGSYTTDSLPAAQEYNANARFDGTYDGNHRPYTATSSIYSQPNVPLSEPNQVYQPYRPPQSPVGRYTQMHRDEAARKLEGSNVEGESSMAAYTSDGDDDDVKSEGSYDFATARAHKVLEEKKALEAIKKGNTA